MRESGQRVGETLQVEELAVECLTCSLQLADAVFVVAQGLGDLIERGGQLSWGGESLLGGVGDRGPLRLLGRGLGALGFGTSFDGVRAGGGELPLQRVGVAGVGACLRVGGKRPELLRSGFGFGCQPRLACVQLRGFGINHGELGEELIDPASTGCGAGARADELGDRLRMSAGCRPEAEGAVQPDDTRARPRVGTGFDDLHPAEDLAHHLRSDRGAGLGAEHAGQRAVAADVDERDIAGKVEEVTGRQQPRVEQAARLERSFEPGALNVGQVLGEVDQSPERRSVAPIAAGCPPVRGLGFAVAPGL